MSILPYSYHTFLFPFIWRTKPEIKLEQFEKILQIGTNWVESKWEALIAPQDFSAEGKSEEEKEKIENKKTEWFQYYQAYQYFTTAANNAIFNADGQGVVKCYEYMRKNGIYSIKKENDVFNLKINKIRLNVYKAGIAIIIFEMENHENRTLEAVNKINEYGRRINFPFLMDLSDETPKSHALCADSITIQFDGAEPIVEDFINTSKNMKNRIAGTDDHHISFNYVMKPIQDIIDGVHDKITSNPEHKDKFLIIPCVDDRMFVCCMVMDEDFSRELQGIGNDGISFLSDTDARIKESGEKYVGVEIKKINGKYVNIECDKYQAYEEGWSDEKSLSSRLYKLLYIENSLSCQDNTMKRDLLKASVYRRWLNMGTIYGITHHSIICVNNGNPAIKEQVINPFLILYVQMAILTLAQRSVLLMLENEAASIANGFKDDTEISADELKEIESLMAKYVKVQNQLLLSEITVQEQGVEIYELLREQLYIPKNMKDLSIDMSNLRDTANIANDRMERRNEMKEEEQNKKIELLATVAGIVISATAIAEPVSQMISDDKCLWTIMTVVFGGIGVAGWLLWKHYIEKNNNKKNKV